MAKNEEIYTWFLEPKDDSTNEVFSGCLNADVDFLKDAMCADGQLHNLWRCTPAMREAFIASRKSKGLDFEVFSSQGKNPPMKRIRNVSFLFSKPRRRLTKPSNQKALVS